MFVVTRSFLLFPEREIYPAKYAAKAVREAARAARVS